MKTSAIAPLFLLLSCLTAVHAIGLDEKIDSVKAKSLLIATEQRTLESDFIREEADCYKRFAVNSCLDKVGARKRTASGRYRSGNKIKRRISATGSARKRTRTAAQ